VFKWERVFSPELRSTVLGRKEMNMAKTLPVIAVAALVAIAAAAPTSVRADDTGAIVGGAIGGLALGAIIGSAASQPGPYYQPRQYYEPVPVYRPAPVYVVPRREVCVEQREVWSNRYQDYVVRNVRVPCY
jgi:hypothetical protein